MTEWHKSTWRSKPRVQMPDYTDEAALNAVEAQLSKYPPLVFAGEARRLKAELAQAAAGRFASRDQWERLLIAGLARDFEQLRLDFLQQQQGEPKAMVDEWVSRQAPRIAQFRRTVDRARTAPVTTAPMLAQIATQARVLMAR